MGKLLKRAGSFLLALTVTAGCTAAVPQLTDGGITADAASVKEKENNDTMASATAFNAGDTVNGAITEDEWDDYYKINLPTSGELIIDLTANIEKLNFSFLDSDGNTLYSQWERSYDDGWCLKWNSESKRIRYTFDDDFTSGTYYIRLKRRDNYLGAYSFTTKFCSSNETFKESGWGNNNSMADANSVVAGKKIIGQIADNDEYDYYKINLASSGTLTTELSANIRKLNMCIYDSDGNEKWSKWERSYDDGWCYVWNDVSKLIEDNIIIDLNKGTYYICLKRRDLYSGNYNLKFSFKSANENFSEPMNGSNNTLASANSIALNKSYNAMLANNDDTDFYKFTTNKKTDIKLSFKSNFRMNLIVYDAKGNELYSRKDGDSVPINDVSNYAEFSDTISLEKGTFYLCFYKYEGQTGTFNFKAETPGATSVKLSKTSVTLDKGKTITLTATVQPGTVYDKSVTWTSSDAKIASVSNGKITAKSGGTATITAKTSNGKTAKCTVKVNDPDVIAGIKLNKTVISLGKGEQTTLKATFDPTNAKNKNLTWTTSNSKIVTVSNGKITGKTNGTATITAKTNNGKTAKCTVTVKNAPSKVTLSKGVLTLGVGEKFSVTSSIPAGSAAEARVYRTSNSSIVKMTRTYWQGDFIAQKPGVAYVTVRLYNGKESTCKVTVKKAPSSVNLNKTSMTLKVGQTGSLSAVIPSDSGCATSTFRTSNSSIVKMTKTNWSGQFKAVKKGVAYVTVRTYNGKEKSCKITVV